MVRLGVWFLVVWELYIACSSAVLSLLWCDSGRDMDVHVHVVTVSGFDENIVFSGSFE